MTNDELSQQLAVCPLLLKKLPPACSFLLCHLPPDLSAPFSASHRRRNLLYLTYTTNQRSSIKSPHISSLVLDSTDSQSLEHSQPIGQDIAAST